MPDFLKEINLVTKAGKVAAVDVLLFRGLLTIIVITVIACIFLESFIPMIAPMLIIMLTAVLDDFRKIFYTLFAVLPFSTEFYFESSGLGTDIPSEPIMIFLTGITVLLLLRNGLRMHVHYMNHPIMILIVLHIFWMAVTTVNSTFPIISLKLLAAKLWYILPFLILPLLFIIKTSEIQKSYRILYIFLFISIVIVLIRHAFEGFTFAASYHVVRPFFRNHVNYAAISVVALPFVWAAYQSNKLKGVSNYLTGFIFLIFIVGIYFSFTRAAILSMLFAAIGWYIIKKRWIRQSLTILGIFAFFGISWLMWNNRYMDFTPEFEKTITHTEFDNLLEATYKLEDISSMERLYRWMAGIEMIRDKFWLGYGPGTFYSNYKSYVIASFQTYVSDNPEQSGIHNYYLMTWVEQGFVGFMILLALCFTVLICGENLYHACRDAEDKLMVMAATLAFIIIFSMCLINDLIETDKVGPFFFFNMAILLFYHAKQKVAVANPSKFG
jgi:O-antigen ligase